MLVEVGGRACEIRAGDVVFHYDPNDEYPVHVGVAVGAVAADIGDEVVVGVGGVPVASNRLSGGISDWGTAGAYRVHFVGQRLDATAAQIAHVALICKQMLFNSPGGSPACRWNQRMQLDNSNLVDGRHPRFVRGTCAHFVQHLYSCLGLSLVEEAAWCPDEPDRLHPPAIGAAFHNGIYPICSWRDEYRSWETAVAGPGADDR